MNTQKRKKRDKKTKRGAVKTKGSVPGKKVMAQVRELAESLCESEGLELVHVEYQRESSGRILRIYIDKEGGVSLEDCTRISRPLSDIIDINLSINETYSLEVSSPGINRPLSKESDFNRFAGQKARIRTKLMINGRKNFKGILMGIRESIVTIKTDETLFNIPYSEINRAWLVKDNGES